MKLETILEAARSTARSVGAPSSVLWEIDAIQWYEGWADDRNESMVVTGNWNEVDKYDRELEKRVPVPGGDIMPRLFDIFERMGYDADWSDGVSMCGSCGKAIQTEPDSHSWTPEYVIGDGEITCTACMDDGGWPAELEGLCHSRGELSNSSVDPSEHGFRPVVELRIGFDGWHDVDRAKCELDKLGIGYFLQLRDNRQFGRTAIVWMSRDDETEIPEDLHGDHDVEQYDNGEEAACEDC